MNTNRTRFAKGKMMVFVILAAAVFTLALMLLWNWLMPVIFGLTTITFWQALGLLVLSKILFGKGQRPSWADRDKSRMHKEQFMQRFGKRKCKPVVETPKEASDENQ